MFGLRGWEIIIVLVVALLLFGTRLPQIGRSLGEAMRGFKKSISGEDEAQAGQLPPSDETRKS